MAWPSATPERQRAIVEAARKRMAEEIKEGGSYD